MDDERDLRRYIEVLGRRKKLIAGVAIGACVLAIAASLLQPHNRIQVSLLIAPGKNTGGLYSDAGAVIGLVRNRGVLALFLERAGLPVDLVESRRPLVAVRSQKMDPNSDIILIGAAAPADSLATAKKVAEAVAAGIVAEGQKEAVDHRQALKQSLEAIIAAESRLNAAPVPTGAKIESDVLLRAITLGTLSAPSTQGLLSSAFQVEKDVALKMLDIQPPRILSVPSVSEPPSVPLLQLGLMSAIVGVVVGIVLAFLAENATRPSTASVGRPAAGRADLPQHGE